MDPACLSHVAVRTQHSCFCWHLHVRLTIESAAAATALPAAMVTKLVYTAIMVASWIDTATADAVAGEHRRLRSTRQGEQEVTVAAGCDQDDEILMTKLGGGSALGSFPKLISECGSRSFNLFDGLDNSTFTSCITASTGVRERCARCFLETAKYGADHCKWSCFWGSWCGAECLKCVESANRATRACAGVAVPVANACM